jgi:hypothetical protein
MWLALKLLASGAADWVLRGLSAAAKWIVSDWRNGPLVVCALMWAAHALLITPKLRADLAASEKLVEATQLAHLETISNFIDASAEAQRQAKANAARVTAEQEKITDATLADLRSDHAALRLRFDRLRARGAAGDPGRADAAGLPGAGDAAGRVAPAPADQDLPAPRNLTGADLTPQPLCPSQFVCLTIDEAEQASEDAHNHDRLIDWVIRQSAVRFTPREPAE